MKRIINDSTLLFFSYILFTSILLSSCSSLFVPIVTYEIKELKGGNYKIDLNHSRVIFKVGHLGLSQYVGQFNQFDARLTFDPSYPENTQLQATVNTGSIDVANENFEETLQNDTWLASHHHPQAFFKSSKITLKNNNRAQFCGRLLLLSTERPFCLDIRFNGGAFNMLSGAYTLGFEAYGEFNRSDFGLNAYRSLVSDKVNIEIYAEFKRL